MIRQTEAALEPLRFVVNIFRNGGETILPDI